MSILEILEDHRQHDAVAKDTRFYCLCGWVSETPRYGYGPAEHRTHVAQVLEEHEREREAAALEEAADEIERLENIGDTAQGELNEEQTAEYWLYHGTPKTTWLRDRAAQIRSQS